MTCKDCVHYKVCGFTSITGKSMEKDCRDFKNKNNFVEVVHCDECKLHSNCIIESSYFTARMPDSKMFCAVGERKCDNG